MKVTSNSDFILGMMPTRLSNLEEAHRGLDSTNTALVGITKQGQFNILGTFDDPGIYWLFPKIANLLHTDVVFAARLSLAFAAVLAAIMFYYGCKKLCNSIFVLPVTLALFLLNLIKSDVYVFNFAAVALIPFSVAVLQQKSIYKWLIIFCCVFYAAYLNQFRSHAGTVYFIFIVVYSAFYLKPLFKKLQIPFFILIAILISNLHFKYLSEERNTYLEANSNLMVDNQIGHPFWHSTYIGLGFIDNKYGITYDDNVAKNLVEKEHPGVQFCGKVYEACLKDHYFQILKSDFLFIAKVYIYKALWVLILLSLLLNVTTLKLWKYAFQETLFWPFALSIFFASMPAILVMPRINYLNTVIALGLFWFLFLLALEKNQNTIT